MINFTNEEYKNRAINTTFNEANVMPSEDAFFVLINGVEYNRLDNLVFEVAKHFNISNEDAYRMLQDLSLDSESKKEILNIAYEVIKSSKLGNAMTPDGRFNLSEFFSHSLYMGKCASVLASGIGINGDVALALGILHDYGRRYDHKFNHVTVGFEKLSDLGYETEALSCLTHSYVHGKVCANNEKAYEGFSVDEFGNEHYSEEKDDMQEFLDSYRFSMYDGLLNIADLSATSYGITNIWERLSDIATRREIDPVNRKYFICELINLLNEYLYSAKVIDSYTILKARNDLDLEDAYEILKSLANKFEEVYRSLEESSDKVIKRV